MRALVHVFLRCVALLLPSHWLQLGFCWWIEDECGKTIWPNPRARFKGRNPLTDQGVSAHDALIPSSSSSSPAPGSISAAASPGSAPQDAPRQGTIGELRQFLARFFGIPLAILRHWFPKRRPLFAQYPFTCKSTAEGIEDSAVVAERSPNTLVAAEESNEPKTVGFIQDSMSAAMELPCPGESMSDSARLVTVEEADDDGQLQGMMTQVKITVAIEAAEDEELEDENSSNAFLEGSGSDDEAGRQDKSSGAGTSGGEVEEASWQAPDPELTEKLVTQIEYYLSDENLEHDAFLLKHVRRNKLGFVSVKLLTSFKKVKHLTRDWRTTAYALRQSTLLELNEEGRKVRRRSPVPVFASESLPSRMLLLSELQSWPELGVALEGGGGGAGDDAGGGGEGGGVTSQECLMELLLKAFGTYGPIASVRVLKLGKELPADLKKLSGRYAQLGAEECAIVEFEEVEAAVRAHEAVACEEEGTSSLGVKVVLIGTKPPKKKVLRERTRDEGGAMRKSRSLNSRVRLLQYLDESTCSSSETESNPATPSPVRKSQSLNKLSPPGGGGGGAGLLPTNHLSPALSPRSSPWSSPRVSPRASPCPQRKSPLIQMSPLASEGGGGGGSGGGGRLSPESSRRWADYSSDSSLTPIGSPWVQRRRQVASQESSPVGSPMLGRKIQNADGLPPGVVRLPRGPDGTRGFHNPSVEERGKTVATQT